MLKHGADTNVLDSNGMAPLHHPCDSQNAAAVAALLGHGANVNLPTNGRGTNANLPKMDGSYPLHIACDVGVVHVKETVVRMLLEHGADVDAIWQTDGSTPLHIACLSHRNHDLGNLVDLLLDQQRNICLLDSLGLTPLHVALSNYMYRDSQSSFHYWSRIIEAEIWCRR